MSRGAEEQERGERKQSDGTTAAVDDSLATWAKVRCRGAEAKARTWGLGDDARRQVAEPLDLARVVSLLFSYPGRRSALKHHFVLLHTLSYVLVVSILFLSLCDHWCQRHSKRPCESFVRWGHQQTPSLSSPSWLQRV